MQSGSAPHLHTHEEPRWSWLAYACVALAALALFSVALFTPFIYDDIGQIVQNGAVHSLSRLNVIFSGNAPSFNGSVPGLMDGFYRPVMFFSYAVLYTLFGEQAWAFHAVQILLHAANAYLLYLLLRRFTPHTPALLGAAVFLVHPLNTEAVTYIADLQDVLIIFFGLLALYRVSARHETLPWRDVASVAAFLTVALLTKESSIAFVALTVLAAVLWHRPNVFRAVVAVGAAAAIPLVTRAFSTATVFAAQFTAIIARQPLSVRLLTIPKALWYYLGHMLWPVEFAVDQQWVVATATAHDFWMPLTADAVFLGVLIALSIVAVRKDRSATKPLLFFAAWFMGGLAMHANIVPLDMTVADRWFTLAMPGLIGMVTVSTAALASQVSPAVRRVSATIAWCAIAVCIPLNIVRQTQWLSPQRLYAHDIRVAGVAPQIETFLGIYLATEGKYDDAERHIRKALKDDPEYANARLSLIQLSDMRGFKEEARIGYKKFIDGPPLLQKAIAYGMLAQMEWQNDGDAYAALRTLKRARAEFPLHAGLVELEAMIRRQMGLNTAEQR